MSDQHDLPGLPDDDYLWNPRAAPAPAVVRIEGLLEPARLHAEPPAWPSELRTIRRTSAGRPFMVGAAIAASIALVLAGKMLLGQMEGAPWSVKMSGAGGSTIASLERGGTVETSQSSRARVIIGDIGRADLEPRSRLRLIEVTNGEHRMALERGSMHASIDAPPRFFLVETPSALVIDLGCEYTLSTDSLGNGTLEVVHGEVELDAGTHRVSVLAGNTASMLSGRGPGLPYPIRTTPALHAAVTAFDRAPTADNVAAVVSAADGSSTITLWHLLRVAPEPSRGAVFDRLAGISPPPKSVTRERVIRGESYALQRWRTDLEKSWTRRSLWATVLSELGNP